MDWGGGGENRWYDLVPTDYLYVIELGLGILLLIIIGLFIHHEMKPLPRPTIRIEVDISGKRSVNYMKELQNYVNNQHTFGNDTNDYIFKMLNNWENECKNMIDNFFLLRTQRKRTEQFYNLREEIESGQLPIISFQFYRNQTCYKQVDNVKYPFQVKVPEYELGYNVPNWLLLYKQLTGINFQTNLYDYSSKDQRKLMTRDLRVSIMQRDNYTCRMCGKYMPDEVGLHIDHIIPVTKGGKSVPDNLQVLCDKCNLRKSNKM